MDLHLRSHSHSARQSTGRIHLHARHDTRERNLSLTQHVEEQPMVLLYTLGDAARAEDKVEEHDSADPFQLARQHARVVDRLNNPT